MIANCVTGPGEDHVCNVLNQNKFYIPMSQSEFPITSKTVSVWNALSPSCGTISLTSNWDVQLFTSTGCTVTAVPFFATSSAGSSTSVDWTAPIIVAGFWTAMISMVIVMWMFKRKI